MEDYRVTQTGDEIQEIFNQSPVDTDDIAELKEAATSLDGRLEAVEGKIPSGASSENPLTDKQYVDSSIASASATFRGTYNEVTDLELTTEATHAEIGEALASVIDTADSNDYCFVQIPTADATPTEIESIERYKFVTGTGWQYEYTLNNSGFTAEQWVAINSGITSGLVAKLTDLPTNAELETLLNGKANAADVYTKSETYNKTELDAQLGAKANSADVYEKSQTYTKQEVDALITTPEVQYVTVTATSGTTSVTDVLPATGAANTIYRVGSWDGTQYATGVYSEYAWNGTTYILLDVKNYGFATGSDFDNPTTAQRELVTTVGSVLDGMPEGVFDVSARNSGSTWASLSALLSDADIDTLIPASWRKGGMSIRFVQSSDNNYVQYRYMSSSTAAADFTNTANWQGVDDKPVAGSKNLIESGAVNKSIGFVNVNVVNGVLNTPYESAVAARGAVPENYRKYGLVITYKLSDGWHVEQYKYDSVIPWSTSNNYWVPYDFDKGDVFYNLNRGNSAASYTLQTAINAVPEDKRALYKPIIFKDANNVVNIAIFNGQALTRWTDVDYWHVYNIKIIEKIQRGDIGNIASGDYEIQGDSSNRQYAIGNSTTPGIIVDSDKLYFNILESDTYGQWQMYVFYADGTKAFVYFRNGLNTFTKKVYGFSVTLRPTSYLCHIKYEVYTYLKCDIEANTDRIEILENKTYTAAEVGAVAENQGAVNAGKVLAINDNGNVVPAENTPAGTLIGYGKIESSLKLDLKADTASEVSVGTGWSGSLANGYTHTSGNTDALVLGHTTEGKSYIVTLGFDAVAENSVEVKIGNGYSVDPYNGSLQSRVGFISDGGDLSIIPASSYTGTITVKLQEVTDVEHSVEEVTITIDNFDAGLMVSDLTGFWNIAIGPDTQTMGKIVNASRNIGIGRTALANLETGQQNIAVGTFALSRLKNGKGNVCVGADTYYRRQGGDFNVAIGKSSMGGSTESVNDNVCIGRSAGEKASGNNNVCIGPTAGYGAAGGCVHIGSNAGFSHNAGLNNIFIGINAGYSGAQRTGSWNTCVGQSSSIGNGISKSVAIGYKAGAYKSNQVVLGNYSTTANDGTIETLVHGDFVVRGTDGVKRQIVFNNDNTVTWTTQS